MPELNTTSGPCTTTAKVCPRTTPRRPAGIALAAEQGYAVAQSNLGVLYERGEGVPLDPVLAYMWYELSATQGSRVALRNKESIALHMSPQQIAEARARTWLDRHR